MRHYSTPTAAATPSQPWSASPSIRASLRAMVAMVAILAWPNKAPTSSILFPLFPYNSNAATVEKEFHHGSIQETFAGRVSLSNAVGFYSVIWIDTSYSRTFSAHVHRYACTDAGFRCRRPSGHHNESNGYTLTNADSRCLCGPHSRHRDPGRNCAISHSSPSGRSSVHNRARPRGDSGDRGGSPGACPRGSSSLG